MKIKRKQSKPKVKVTLRVTEGELRIIEESLWFASRAGDDSGLDLDEEQRSRAYQMWSDI